MGDRDRQQSTNTIIPNHPHLIVSSAPNGATPFRVSYLTLSIPTATASRRPAPRSSLSLQQLRHHDNETGNDDTTGYGPSPNHHVSATTRPPSTPSSCAARPWPPPKGPSHTRRGSSIPGSSTHPEARGGRPRVPLNSQDIGTEAFSGGEGTSRVSKLQRGVTLAGGEGRAGGVWSSGYSGSGRGGAKGLSRVMRS